MRDPLPKELFFEKMEMQGLALTYNDVRLKTGHSEVMPDDVAIESRFARNIPLRVPIVSSAMDTVTEHRMARAMAINGGLGVIHKNMTAKEQAKQIARVKRHLHAMIRDPICVRHDETLEQVLNRRTEKGWGFHSFPVLEDNRLVGVLTESDFGFCEDKNVTAKQAMSHPPVYASEDTSMDRAYEIMIANKKKVLPLIDESMRVVGLYTFRDISRIRSGDSQHYNVDDNGQLRVAAAIGVYDDAFERVEELLQEYVDVVVVDTAHGDSKGVLETLKILKGKYDSLDVAVGNVSEARSAKRLLDAGADGIKVGQGPGSICTTRIIAGIGTPQVTAIYECAKIIGNEVPICADGGLQFSGDIPIAIGAGAHNVMMGSLLAGTDEAPGDVVYYQGRKFKSYRGMGSIGAMEEHQGSRERYSQGKSSLIAEGVEGLVPYKGSVGDVLVQYVGGLRRGMGYVGAADIEELRKKADFRRPSAGGQAESHPHDITITKDAPNYPGK